MPRAAQVVGPARARWRAGRRRGPPGRRGSTTATSIGQRDAPAGGAVGLVVLAVDRRARAVVLAHARGRSPGRASRAAQSSWFSGAHLPRVRAVYQASGSAVMTRSAGLRGLAEEEPVPPRARRSGRRSGRAPRRSGRASEDGERRRPRPGWSSASPEGDVARRGRGRRPRSARGRAAPSAPRTSRAIARLEYGAWSGVVGGAVDSP